MLAVPLRDATGEVVSLQQRAIAPVAEGTPKVLSMPGRPIRETCFLNGAAVQALRGEIAPAVPAILGEGLTDFLALAAASSGRWPVACVPGADRAGDLIVSRIGSGGRIVFVALDQDEAGEKAACRAAGTISAAGGRPKRLRWPPGHKDACDLVEAYGLEALEAALAEAVGNV
jgi:DNA primase